MNLGPARLFGVIGSGLAAWLIGTGCSPPETVTLLVVTQAPVAAAGRHMPQDALDVRYPNGTRVIVVDSQVRGGRARVLSRGLVSAGAPVLSPCGRRVLFCGKANEREPWQIYEAAVRGGQPAVRTRMEGGAMDPGWLPDGRMVFASPVPGPEAAGSAQRTGLFAQTPGQDDPQRLTHGLETAEDPAVLRDGRIVFDRRDRPTWR